MEKRVGNILNVENGIIVHGCNNQGVWGAGLALSIKRKYPEAYKLYRDEWERRSGFNLGEVQFYFISYNKIICNAITQENYGRDKRYVNYDAVRKAFEKIYPLAAIDNIPIHFPKIGCGLGGGDWNIVKNIIEEEINGHESYVWVLKEDEQI
jgi:O-acetyl-ADP-ribose deacetylase (regulator of RNase III)